MRSIAANAIRRCRIIQNMYISGARGSLMNFQIELEQDDDGRIIAEIPALPGVLAYGHSREEVIVRAEALALRVLADRLDHGESVPDMTAIFSIAA